MVSRKCCSSDVFLESVLDSDFQGTGSSGDDSDIIEHISDSEDWCSDKYMEQSNSIDIAVPEKYMRCVI
jgi:hypothetical protein